MANVLGWITRNLSSLPSEIEGLNAAYPKLSRWDQWQNVPGLQSSILDNISERQLPVFRRLLTSSAFPESDIYTLQRMETDPLQASGGGVHQTFSNPTNLFGQIHLAPNFIESPQDWAVASHEIAHGNQWATGNITHPEVLTSSDPYTSKVQDWWRRARESPLYTNQARGLQQDLESNDPLTIPVARRLTQLSRYASPSSPFASNVSDIMELDAVADEGIKKGMLKDIFQNINPSNWKYLAGIPAVAAGAAYAMNPSQDQDRYQNRGV